MFNLTLSWSWNSYLQTPRPNRLYNLTQAFTICDNSTKGHVRLHSPPERSLSTLGQVIKFMNNNDLKRFLLFLIQLLTTGYFLNQFLNNDLIVIISLARSDFNMVVAGKDDAFDRSGAGSTSFKFF